MFEILETDIAAGTYKPMVERLCDVCDTFTFAVLPKRMMGQTESLRRLLTELDPYLKEVVHANGTCANLFEPHISAANHHYHICEQSRRVILGAADDLFAWQQPELPEDLSFLKKEKEYFVTNAHEGYAMLFEVDSHLLELRGSRWIKTD